MENLGLNRSKVQWRDKIVVYDLFALSYDAYAYPTTILLLGIQIHYATDAKCSILLPSLPRVYHCVMRLSFQRL